MWLLLRRLFLVLVNLVHLEFYIYSELTKVQIALVAAALSAYFTVTLQYKKPGIPGLWYTLRLFDQYISHCSCCFTVLCPTQTLHISVKHINISVWHLFDGLYVCQSFLCFLNIAFLKFHHVSISQSDSCMYQLESLTCHISLIFHHILNISQADSSVFDSGSPYRSSSFLSFLPLFHRLSSQHHPVKMCNIYYGATRGHELPARQYYKVITTW